MCSQYHQLHAIKCEETVFQYFKDYPRLKYWFALFLKWYLNTIVFFPKINAAKKSYTPYILQNCAKSKKKKAIHYNLIRNT